MCLLAAHLQQYRSSLCLHPESESLLLCFYIASLWLRRFIWVGRWRVVFGPSFLCVWSQRPWRSRQIILLPRGFLHVHVVKIYDVVDLFLRKPFWFFSTLGSMRLRSRTSYIFAAMDVRVIPQ